MSDDLAYTLKANTRMYDVSASVAEAWLRLVKLVREEADVPLEMLAHPAPKPVEELWARTDLGLVLMCGWPFHRARPQPIAVAAPVLAHSDGDDQPLYWTDMIVSQGSAAQILDDTFGGILAWTVTGSHSGYNAPRHLLRPYFESSGAPLYRKTVGPVITPRAAIEAVMSGKADVAPLDAYFHLLLQRHEPQTAAGIKVVARTPKAPIPLFTASRNTDPTVIDRLRQTLTGIHTSTVGQAVLSALCLKRFVTVEPESYAFAEAWHDAAIQAGYSKPA